MDLSTKICRECGAEKSVSEFNKTNKIFSNYGVSKGCKPYCKSCDREIKRKWRQDNVLRLRQKEKQFRNDLKSRVIKALGNQCACCGELNKEFLTVDHINGDGHLHRKEKSSSVCVHKDIENQGFPRDKYRVLCMNCNCSIAWFGYCPHKIDRVVTEMEVSLANRSR